MERSVYSTEHGQKSSKGQLIVLLNLEHITFTCVLLWENCPTPPPVEWYWLSPVAQTGVSKVPYTLYSWSCCCFVFLNYCSCFCLVVVLHVCVRVCVCVHVMCVCAVCVCCMWFVCVSVCVCMHVWWCVCVKNKMGCQRSCLELSICLKQK